MQDSNKAHHANRLLARTINLPLHLGSPKEDKPTVHVTDKHLDAIAAAGFSAIRINAHWTAHTNDSAPYQIEPAALEKTNTVVQAALKRGLAVIICNHPDTEIMTDPAAYKNRFLAVTQQVAEHFKITPAPVLLEILAEPQAKLNKLWNQYLAEALAVVRRIDPDRTVIIGPASYNNARMLPKLQLPSDDQNIIVTVHHYWPIKFTMQGEKWLQVPWYMKLLLGKPSTWQGTTWEGTPKQRASQDRTFSSIAKWATQHGRPIFVGEFGSSSHADMPSRARWTQYVRELAEHHNFSWGYWAFGPTFELYDQQKEQWRPELLQSLMPTQASSKNQ